MFHVPNGDGCVLFALQKSLMLFVLIILLLSCMLWDLNAGIWESAIVSTESGSVA